MELSEFSFAKIHLVTSERIISSLNLSESLDKKRADDPETIVLSNKRLMYFPGALNQKQIAFIPVDEITSVEINVEDRNKNAYLWAALAFVLSISLILIIDPFFIRLVTSLIVGLMGLYLIIDHVLSTTMCKIQFKSNSSEISCRIKPEHVVEKAYPFIREFFELKNNPQDVSHIGYEIDDGEGENDRQRVVNGHLMKKEENGIDDNYDS